MALTFHLFDALAEDCHITDGTETKDMYTIHLFGSTPEGTPVRIDATGFEPFFYVGLPAVPKAFSKFQTHFQSSLVKLKETLSEKRKLLDIESIEIREMKKMPMYGYRGGKPIHVVEIKTTTRKIFYDLRKLFLNERSQPIYKLFEDSPCLEVYDATLDPMLRFFHLRNLQPSGWVEALVDTDDEDGTLVGNCSWEEISPCLKPPMASAPFLTNFWDIECYSASGNFPIAKRLKDGKDDGDPIIQIGNVLVQQGKPTEKHIFVLGTCDPVPGATVHSCKTEKDLILSWAGFMAMKNPDILVGYNIFGFDEKYLWERAEVLKIDQKPALQSLNRMTYPGSYHSMKLVEKFLSSSALGDNYLYMWNTTGRLQIDLYHYIRRSASLPSYKLDAVCEFYMSGKLSSVDTSSVEGKWCLKTKQTGDVLPGRFIVLLDETGEPLVDKMKVVSVDPGKSVYVEAPANFENDLSEVVKWAVVKDDVPPSEIFRLHREDGASGRARVAAYCIQDCDLVHELYKKLDVFNNAMSMANVCSVPISYIFTRGQGIKIESLIFKECHERGIVVQVLPSQARESDASSTEEAKEDSYEGAIVLDPIPGFYTDSPIGVCDFASLYPSTIISEDISHDSLVWVKDYDLKGNLMDMPVGSDADELFAPPGTRWTDIDFDIWRPDPNDKRKTPEKIRVGVRVCRYAQKPDGTKHTLPDIVAKLLAARKAKRKEAEKEEDPFRKALLDAEQLAYKLTANSLYGQLGSATFKVRLQHLAASVTSYGRKQILFAKAAIEKFYGPEAKDPRCCATIVYGDTDSLFVDFAVRNPETGVPLKGTEAVEATMHITEEAGKFITGALKPPHDFEYDKVFDQFIIFSKKRYVGNKYEESATDFKQTSMGIVLKRRDNAPILKTIYGGAIKILLNERDVPKAVAFVREKTAEMIEGKMSLGQLTITKSLSMYKADWIKKDIAELEAALEVAQKGKKTEKILQLETQLAKKRVELENAPSVPAHKILADRMAIREPGNAPSSGERLGFVYIAAAAGQEAPKLQGDRIETPDYIRSKGLQPDYRYYIEHQLMKPIGQLFSLMVEKIPEYPSVVLTDEVQREKIAIDLLFGKALASCDKLAVRNFVAKQFGCTVGKNTEVVPVQRRTSPRFAEDTAPKKTQTNINTYFVHKMIAAEATALKKEKKQKEKKDK
jgi:DNA polymerase elongation subunit (family B)